MTGLPHDARILVTGHRGLAGSAIVRKLQQSRFSNIITASHEELDLTSQQQTNDFFGRHKPQIVFLAAAKVGGIVANDSQPAEFIYKNLMIAANTTHAAWQHGVQRMLFLGSSCIYPRQTPQPMTEDQLLSGRLEPTNESYAVAKIAGIKLCESYNRQYGCDFRTLMPCNLYGPGDNYHAVNSHVIPAMIRRFCAAADNGSDEIVLWGSGQVYREFLHSDDLASACLFIMEQPVERLQAVTAPQLSHFNVGYGSDLTLRELADMIAALTDYKGSMRWDRSRPDGVKRKLLNSELLQKLGWQPAIDLESGLRSTIAEYKALRAHLRH